MKIKLRWYKWLAKRAYLRCRTLLDEVDCGVALLKEINPRFAKEDARFRSLMKKCYELEGIKKGGK